MEPLGLWEWSTVLGYVHLFEVNLQSIFTISSTLILFKQLFQPIDAFFMVYNYFLALIEKEKAHLGALDPADVAQEGWNS